MSPGLQRSPSCQALSPHFSQPLPSELEKRGVLEGRLTSHCPDLQAQPPAHGPRRGDPSCKCGAITTLPFSLEATVRHLQEPNSRGLPWQSRG